MIRNVGLLLIIGSAALAMACGGATSEKPTLATSTVASSGSAGSDIGPDGDLLSPPPPALALTAALEAISGFDITSVTFRGDDVTVKYDQVVNEPAELLLLRWLDFASVAVTFVDSPNGDIVIVPQVDQTDIASVRMRAVDLLDFLDGKRPLEDLLASIEIK